jgi:hypothetical protein
MNSRKILYRLTFMAVLGLFSLSVQADEERMFNVSITNLTHGISFTPIFVVSHKKGMPLFTLGTTASNELTAIAEGGDFQPMSDKLTNSGMAFDTATNGALLAPGETTIITVKTKTDYNHISVASMLLPTNDAFIAINGVKVSKRKPQIIMSPAYDAGSETNDELCAQIPGPTCGGSPFSPTDMGEGYVHIHPGIQGIGDLTSSMYDWRNPTAKITIERMR